MTGLTFADPLLGELFADNGWRSFEDLWRLEAREVEPGNVRVLVHRGLKRLAERTAVTNDERETMSAS